MMVLVGGEFRLSERVAHGIDPYPWHGRRTGSLRSAVPALRLPGHPGGCRRGRGYPDRACRNGRERHSRQHTTSGRQCDPGDGVRPGCDDISGGHRRPCRRRLHRRCRERHGERIVDDERALRAVSAGGHHGGLFEHGPFGRRWGRPAAEPLVDLPDRPVARGDHGGDPADRYRCDRLPDGLDLAGHWDRGRRRSGPHRKHRRAGRQSHLADPRQGGPDQRRRSAAGVTGLRRRHDLGDVRGGGHPRGYADGSLIRDAGRYRDHHESWFAVGRRIGHIGHRTGDGRTDRSGPGR